tara:strand:+ start:334 stop:711 length:378 start_codon:yes stop_codon:yes gene_type:complete
MTIPHIKLTDTMLNKYIIDAKKDILDQFEIDPSGEFDLTWLEPIYISADYESDTEVQVQIKFYLTARGDKRMSIPNLRKYAKVGDYVWFQDISQEDGGEYFRIHIGKELPVDKRKQYEQLQERFG